MFCSNRINNIFNEFYIQYTVLYLLRTSLIVFRAFNFSKNTFFELKSSFKIRK